MKVDDALKTSINIMSSQVTATNQSNPKDKVDHGPWAQTWSLHGAL